MIAGSELRVVSTMSVGTDHMDVKECKKRGVFVSWTPDVASDSAAELSVALTLITTRRIAEGKCIIYVRYSIRQRHRVVHGPYTDHHSPDSRG